MEVVLLFRNYDIIDGKFSSGLQLYNVNYNKETPKKNCHIKEHCSDTGLNYDSILDRVAPHNRQGTSLVYSK